MGRNRNKKEQIIRQFYYTRYKNDKFWLRHPLSIADYSSSNHTAPQPTIMLDSGSLKDLLVCRTLSKFIYRFRSWLAAPDSEMSPQSRLCRVGDTTTMTANEVSVSIFNSNIAMQWKVWHLVWFPHFWYIHPNIAKTLWFILSYNTKRFNVLKGGPVTYRLINFCHG